jgi:6-phosphogluconolactonase
MAVIQAGLRLGLAFLTLFATTAPAAESGSFYLYAGTYTGKSSKGIYLYRFVSGVETLDAKGLAAETPNPTFLAISPNHKFLYAANEIGNFHGQKTGSVSAYRIDSATGQLTFLNTVPSQGAGPCHLSVDRSGRFVLVANYDGGSIAVLRAGADGSLGEATAAIQYSGSSVNKSRQGEPHAHSIYVSRDNRFVVSADLGTDRLMLYRFDARTGTLEPNDPPFVALKPGAGPRHFAFHPNGKVAYSINELQSTVTVFDWNGVRGTLAEKQTVSTLPPDFAGENTDAEIEIHPNGRFLYASNRGHDSIAIFTIAADGTLSLADVRRVGVKTPRHFAIAPTGNYLFAEGQNSDRFVLFRLDANTGRLTPTAVSAEIGAPVCLQFVPAPGK